jgi:hypothetical protein
VRRGRRIEPARELGVEPREARVPGRRLGQLLEQRAGVEHVVERHDAVEQLVHRHCEQPPRGRRREVELDAVLHAVVLGRRGGVGEAGDERAVRLAADPDARAEREDHRDPAGGGLAPPQRLSRPLEVAAVAVHDAAQRRPGRGVRHLPAPERGLVPLEPHSRHAPFGVTR